MVINVGWLKSGLLDEVKADIAAVREVCAAIPLKVILKPACSAMHRSSRFVKCVANSMWCMGPPHIAILLSRKI